MRKICFVTGSRAEYGLLSRLMRMVKDDAECELQVVATNMHLLPEYGYTYREIERDGFVIDRKVVMRKSTDDAHGVVESMSQEMIGVNDAFASLRPDLVVILGDRYEMLVVATVAMLYRIPIAHLHGGEVTEGAYDDSIRHCITKLSSLHFASTEVYRQRIIQLGECPERVFNTGAIGVENLQRVPLVGKAELEEYLGFEISPRLILATYHPVTLSQRSGARDIDDFLRALDTVGDAQVIFTMPNSDEGSGKIRQAIKDYCGRWPMRCHCFDSLGLARYLSLMGYATAVVGNSSSGIIEVPSAHIPTLNIGDRQKGRVHGASVVDCQPDYASVVEGLRRVLSPEMRSLARRADNPYYKPGTAQQIFDVISTWPLDELIPKTFYDLNK